VIFYNRNTGPAFDRKARDHRPHLGRHQPHFGAGEIVRKAKPLLSVDLRDIAERLKPNKPIDARDGALLTVGWAGALRRCELVGLDWVLPADGTGFVTVDERGIVITLMTSKPARTPPSRS
jgi:integrase